MHRRLAAERRDRARGARALALRDVEDDAHAAGPRWRRCSCAPGRTGRRARGSRRPRAPSTLRQNSIQVSSWSAARPSATWSMRDEAGVGDARRRRAARATKSAAARPVGAERGRHEVDQHAAGREDAPAGAVRRRRAGCRSAPRASRSRASTARAASSETRPIAQTRRALLVEARARDRPRLGVDDEQDLALAKQRHALGAMAADAAEAELREQRAERRRARVVDAELDEGEAAERARRRRIGSSTRSSSALRDARVAVARAGRAPRFRGRAASASRRRRCAGSGVSRKTSLKISSDSGPV